MHFKSAAFFAAILASQAAALALPSTDDVVIGGSDATGDEATDLIAAYEQVVDAIPEPVAVPVGTGNVIINEDTSEIAAAAVADATSGSLEKRDIFKRVDKCGAQPTKFTTAFGAPDVAKKSRAEWEANTYWETAAKGAATPANYFRVTNWRNLKASLGNEFAGTYRGFTSDLTSYDPSVCAARCSKISGCTSFVMYFERNPVIKLDKTQCPAADAQTLIKCAFYGISVKSSQATNVGQTTGADFYTSIAGSNAYSTVPQTPDGFSGPVEFGDKTIMAPKGSNTYMGIQTFPGASYNPQLCADACQEKTAYNQRQATRQKASTWRTCRFFDAYVALKENSAPMFTCTYYTESYGVDFATNFEQFNSAGERFSHADSRGYTLI